MPRYNVNVFEITFSASLYESTITTISIVTTLRLRYTVSCFVYRNKLRTNVERAKFDYNS